MIRLLDSLCLQYHPKLRLLRWEWYGPMSLGRFQLAFGELLLFSSQHGANRWLVDSAGMPPLGCEEQAWLSEFWLPRVRHLPLRHLALVLPDGLHNRLVVDSVISDGRQYLSVNVQFFSDAPAALDWLTGSEALMLEMEREWQAAHAIRRQSGQWVF
ncbi:MAG: hypothetical protein H7Z21_10425 [Hymenobacter sp.]|nr:hypothetical protein [Hymenobacter sp.]